MLFVYRGYIFLFIIVLVSHAKAMPENALDSSTLYSLKNDTIKVRHLLIFADTAKLSSKSKLIMIQTACKLADDLNYTDGVINAFNFKGMSFIRLGKHYEALLVFDSLKNYLEKSLETSKSINLQKSLSRSYSNIGATYEEIGELEKAMDYYYKSLELSEKINDLNGIGRVLNNIGNYHFVNRELDKAKQMFYKALKTNRTVGNQNFIFDNLNNLSAVYKRYGDFDSALLVAGEALEIASKNNWIDEQATIHMNIADIYADIGNRELAKEEMHLAADLFKSKNLLHNLSFAYLYLSDLYLIDNQDSSLYYLNNASELSASIKTLHFLSGLYNRKYKFFKHYNHFDSALLYHEKYMTLHDSIFNIESKKRIEELNITYQVDKKETLISYLENQNKTKSRLQIFLIAFVITMFVLSILLIVNLKARGKLVKQKQIIIDKNKELSALALKEKDQQNKLLEEARRREEMERLMLKETLDKEMIIKKLEQEKFESELKHKNRELSTSIMLINNKNEILQTIKEKILRLSLPQDIELKSIISDINSNVQLEKDWEQFKLHFENVHVGFFKKLKQDYPELTENDLRLCAYLKLSMNTKEIAQMNNVTVAAINKQRQRLRRKMNMDQNADFAEILFKY